MRKKIYHVAQIMPFSFVLELKIVQTANSNMDPKNLSKVSFSSMLFISLKIRPSVLFSVSVYIYSTSHSKILASKVY